MGGQAVQWQTGSSVFQGVSVLLMRVSAHVFKPCTLRLRNDLGVLPCWTQTPCLQSAYGLCCFNW